MLTSTIPARSIQAAKDSRGRVTHWHCSACGWSTADFVGSSSAMALKAISDAYDAHTCQKQKAAKLVRSV
jgi:hypothetical protein